METVSTLQEVREFEMNRGGTRYVAVDADNTEYTTFRDAIGERAKQLQGSRVTITYHEEQRGRYTNVYLDAVAPAPPQATPSGVDTDPQEAAWQTAVDAAPWLVGEPGQAVEPDELYEKLKPFEERVEADIEASRQKPPQD